MFNPLYEMRGSVGKPILQELSPAAQTHFSASARIQMLPPEDIYGSKLCAALDRQHPRDLFDVSQLLTESGITPRIRRAFVVYLASHPRPMNELLRPNLVNISAVFENQFAGMSRDPVTKKGEPEWDLLDLPHIERLPALQWKLINIRKMDPKKRADAFEQLQLILNVRFFEF